MTVTHMIKQNNNLLRHIEVKKELNSMKSRAIRHDITIKRIYSPSASRNEID